jgi:hypothetical protein
MSSNSPINIQIVEGKFVIFAENIYLIGRVIHKSFVFTGPISINVEGVCLTIIDNAARYTFLVNGHELALKTYELK